VSWNVAGAYPSERMESANVVLKKHCITLSSILLGREF
jgi:hypothetical protein